MKDHVSKDSIIDLKNQYELKRADMEKELSLAQNKITECRANLNAFEGALAACDVILRGIEEQSQQEEKQEVIQEQPEPEPKPEKSRKITTTRR